MVKGIKRKSPRYLIFGNGYIGSLIKEKLGKNAIVISDQISRYNLYDVSYYIHNLDVDVVINCIGITGNPNVDWCEDHKEETYFSNVVIAKYMSDCCKKLEKTFITIGTGCIYNSTTPIKNENAPANFFNSFYIRTKIMAEDLIQDNHKTINFRIRFPLSDSKSPKNILQKVRGFDNVTDTENSLTFVKDLINAIPFCIKNKIYGNINMVHPQTTTMEKLALALDKNPQIVKQDDLAIGKRANVVLVPTKLLRRGFKFVNFNKELKRCIEATK